MLRTARCSAVFIVGLLRGLDRAESSIQDESIDAPNAKKFQSAASPDR
jgi:hypothetical protein